MSKCRFACNSVLEMRIKFYKERILFFENEIKINQQLIKEYQQNLENELKKECNCGVNANK